MEESSAAGLARWYVIRVLPGRERLIAKQLERRGVMLYLPQIDRHIIVKTARGTNARVMQWAMFSGLIFIYSLYLDWNRVFEVPGVREVVGPRRRRAGGDGLETAEPYVVPDNFIQTMKWLELYDSDQNYGAMASRLASIERPPETKRPGRRGKRGWRKRRRK